ncbi:MAG: site-specific integrase [Eggerthellaceae bacterium]|nr:site-specific integrase [Eggerthellaceae bacterium]MBQ3342684.1 site-specific integrase [Kiritimatiellia bacterium]
MKPTGGYVEQLEKDRPRSRCRKWRLVANFGKVDGKYPHRYKRFDGTYREAKTALAAWLHDLELEDEREKSPTFGEYARRWHERRVRSGMYAERTMDGEGWRVNALVALLGDLQMDEVTRRDVEDCYTRLSSGESPSGKPWKPSSVNSMHKTLSTIFSDAVRDAVIDSKPTFEAKRPQVPQVERNVPTTRMVDAMVESLDPREPHQMAVMLCACLGLRRSEAVMVEKSDFDGKRVHVTKAAEEDGTEKPTKTVRIREVPAPPILRDAIEAAPDGKLAEIRPKVLTRWWCRNRGRWGMEGVRLHDLRHAYATRLAEAGVHPRVMMQLGGWETIEVCMNIYTHVHSSSLDDAVERAFS